MAFMARNIDYDYVNKRINKNDIWWRSHEKKLYYSYKNENYIIPTILLDIVCFFSGGFVEGTVGIILVTLGALAMCHNNNVALDNNPDILKQRMYARNVAETTNFN